jgi:hypothetical protein
MEAKWLIFGYESFEFWANPSRVQGFGSAAIRFKNSRREEFWLLIAFPLPKLPVHFT